MADRAKARAQGQAGALAAIDDEQDGDDNEEMEVMHLCVFLREWRVIMWWRLHWRWIQRCG